MRYKVAQPCLIAYGSANKAWICLNRGQIWDLKAYPSKRFKCYTLWRHSVSIDVLKEDFDRIFEPQEREG